MAATFRYERSLSMAAPAERIVPFIEDFHQWARWSPWEKLDAQLQKAYSGPVRGVGAGYAWSGKKAGAGNMQITEVTPTRVAIALNFVKPFKAHNTAEFLLAAAEGGTRVTWAMTGRKTLMNSVFGLFMNMDRMIGRDFEAGLAALKAIAEAR